MSYYKALEIYTGYFDVLDILLFSYPSSTVIMRDYCMPEQGTQYTYDNGLQNQDVYNNNNKMLYTAHFLKIAQCAFYWSSNTIQYNIL